MLANFGQRVEIGVKKKGSIFCKLFSNCCEMSRNLITQCSLSPTTLNCERIPVVLKLRIPLALQTSQNGFSIFFQLYDNNLVSNSKDSSCMTENVLTLTKH